jgi:VanZ family protein
MMRVLSLWLPVLLWMAALFGFSAQSSGGGGLSIPDWASHGTAYAILSGLVCRALAGGWRAPLTRRGALLAVLLSTAYGVSDEYHQSFVPHRDASLADVGKDFGGALLAAGLWRAFARRDDPTPSNRRSA